jgi:hypothetical protein
MKKRFMPQLAALQTKTDQSMFGDGDLAIGHSHLVHNIDDLGRGAGSAGIGALDGC